MYKKSRWCYNVSAWKSVGIFTSETIPFDDLTPIKKYFDNKIGL